jgi:cytochrome c biogenesis protein CcdA
MTIASIGLAFIAGVLSILSPCVLPLLPLVLGAAASDHKLGPVARTTGLAMAFVAIGLFVATIGHSLGLNEAVFRNVAAVLLLVIGAVLVLPGLQTRLAVAAGPLANWTDQRFGHVRGKGLRGQFWIGVLLGAVWSPCVGPILGAASLLAAQGRDLPRVGITMLAFGIGAALPLLALGLMSREVLTRGRKQLLSVGKSMKIALGSLLAAIGALVLSGFDKSLEAVLVEASPQWLTDLTTRF